MQHLIDFFNKIIDFLEKLTNKNIVSHDYIYIYSRILTTIIKT